MIYKRTAKIRKPNLRKIYRNKGNKNMIGSKVLKKGILFRYAPLWTILLAIIATLAQTVGTRYIMQKELKFTKSDFKSAIMGALFGYFGLKPTIKKTR